MLLPDSVAIIVSIVFMASTIVVSAALVLRTRPLPYLAIHLVITSLFGWSFMFPFWAPRLLG